MTAPRPREQRRPPSPTDRLPPRRGGGSSPYICRIRRRPAALSRPRVARRSLIGSARALAAAACLCLVGALALPATAQAQEIALVSNIAESQGGIANIYSPAFGEQRVAQRFTTGPNTAGYKLQSVVLNLGTNLGTGPVVHVAIHENNSSGNPGTRLAVLKNPADPIGDDTGTAGNRTFSASSPLSLVANTKYWVVVRNAGTTSSGFDVSLTTSTNQTTTQGFSIWDTRLYQGTPGSWVEVRSYSVRMEVRGTVAIPPGLDVTLHLDDDEPLEDTERPTVTATASPASPVPFTVTISATPVAPATVEDFTLSTNRVLSFAANATESTGTVRILPVADDDPEPPDIVTVSGAVSNAAIPDPDDVTLTIINDDPDFPQDIAVDAPASVDEDAGTAAVTVTLTTRRNTAPVIDVNLFYRRRPETATPGNDYTLPFHHLTRFAIVPVSAFSPNAAGTAYVAQHAFTIGIVDDREAETDETIVFQIYSQNNNTGSPAHTITLRDDDAIVPGRPTGLTALRKSQTRIQLAWTAPANYGSFAITGYRIEASEDGGSSWDVVARTRDARTDFRHGGLSAGDTRHYRVSAISDAGASAPSGVASATTVSAGPAATNSALPPPADVTAAPKLPGQIRLGWWTPVAGGGIDEYQYRRRAVGTSDWTNWNTVNASAGFHSRFLNNLDAGTAYEFQVRSVDKDDRYSTTVSALATATSRPTISIARPSGTVTEGEPLRFTLSRDQPHGRLMVIVRLSETGDMLSQEGNSGNPDTQHEQVRFGDGNTTKRLVVETVNDRGGPESDSRITAEVMPYPLHPGNPDNEKLYAVHASRGSATKKVTARVPPTCTANPGDLWCGVVTVGETTGAYGYNEFRDVGYLSDTDFDVGTNSHTINIFSVAKQTVVEGAGNLTFYLLEPPNTADQETLRGLTLHVDSDRFKLSDTEEGRPGQYYWVGTGLNWSREEYVIARLREASSAQRALQGRFVSPPERHDGTNRVKVRVAFSEPVEESPENVGAHGVEVEGGEVTSVSPVGGNAPDGAGNRSVGGRNAGREDREVVWEFEIEPDSDGDLTISLDAGRPCGEPGAICTADGRSLSEGISTTVEGPDTGPPPLTASFEDMPEAHDGESTFRFHVAFSENIGISYRSLREDAFTVTGGRVTRGRRVDDRRDLFEMTVEPEGEGEVTVTLPAGRECSVSGAICTKGENRRQLTNAPTATVAGPAVETGPAGLTARFVDMPSEHDGETAFKFRIAFSEEIRMSGRRLRSDVVAVSGGRATRAGRVNRRKDLWKLKVRPDSLADVTVTLSSGAACDTPGAVCTADGRALSNTISATVRGPVAVSVADARAREGEDETIDFAVSLSRAASGAVSVTYATADGTATAGSDYTRASGKLRFAPGETEKTISVPVLDDAHDEGEETMTLRLSAASGAAIADGVATGTIENTDHMPRAWMVRFGRTVGSHVVDALGERLEGGAAPSHVTVGGIRITGAPGVVPEADTDDPFGLPEWATKIHREEAARTLTRDDLLLRSAFHLSSGGGEAAEPAFTTWGRVSMSGFEAEVDDVTMDGDVTTGHIGFDAEWERVLAGVMVSQSSGEGDYRLSAEQGGDAGSVKSSLTGVYPYARLALSGRMSAWALAGAGSGELTLTQEGGKPMPTDIAMRMGAVGFKGQVLDGTGASGVALNVKSDAMWVGTKSERTHDMVATEGDVTRLRLIVEGERSFEAASGATFTPSAQLGVRHDGGDAETGTGVEVGAGLRYTVGAVTIEAQARTLLAHEASGYEEWGMSGAVRVTPGASGRGLTLSIAPAWGQTGSAAERLWSAQKPSALGSDSEFEPESRLEMDVGYGFGLPGNRGVLTPYAGMTLGDARARTVRTGTRWQLGTDAVLGLETTRQTSDAGETDNRLMLRAALRF